MDDLKPRVTSHAIAKAIRNCLTNGKTSLETSALYTALSNQEVMNGNGILAESVWNELALLAAPGDQAHRTVAVSVEVSTGKITSLKPQWSEIKATPSASSDDSNPGTMRRWPSLSASLHLISTWYGYSLYIPASALDVLSSTTARGNGFKTGRYAPCLEALTKLDGFPPGTLNALMATVSKESSGTNAKSTRDQVGLASVGVIISATWLAPHALCSRAWTSFEESLPLTIVPKEVQASSSTYAFPGTQDEEESSQDSTTAFHRRTTSTPMSALSMDRPLPATPPITPTGYERKPRRSFFGLIRRPSTPSSPSISRNVSFKVAEQPAPDATPATSPAASDPSTTEPSSGSTGGSSGGSTGSSCPATQPSQVTSTSTSNAGTGVAVAIGPKSAAAATATHGPTFSLTEPISEDQNQNQNQNPNSNSNANASTAGGSKRATQTLTGGGNLQFSGSFALFKLGIGGGGRRAREVEQRAAYEREQAAKREEKLALMLAATRVGVAGGGVAVAVPGSSASASFSASAAGDTTDAEAEQGQTATNADGTQTGSDDTSNANGNAISSSNSTSKANGSADKSAVKKLHSSKGQIQTQFIKEEEEEEADEEGGEADKKDEDQAVTFKKVDDKPSGTGRSITRTTV